MRRDFNRWNDNKFHCEGRSWGDGDFTGDGSVDASDFNLWNSARFTGNGLAAHAADVEGNSRAPRAPNAEMIAEASASAVLIASTIPRPSIRADEPVWPRAIDTLLSDFHEETASFMKTLQLSRLDGDTFDSATRWARAPQDMVRARQIHIHVSRRDLSRQDSVDLVLASEVDWHDAFGKRWN